MKKGLRFFDNSIFGEGKRVSRKVTSRGFSISDCLFLTPDGLDSQEGPIEIKFRVGDIASFLGHLVTVNSIMLDSKNNVIYKIVYQNGKETSVHQSLLEDYLVRKEVSFKEETSDNAVDAPVFRNTLVEALPKENPVEKKVTEKELPQESEQHLVTQKTQIKDETAEIKVDDIFKFLKLDSNANELGQMENILKLYKFLVQNPSYDEAIIKELTPDFESHSIEQNDTYARTLKASLAFQALLLRLGIGSRVITSIEHQNGAMYNALLVPFSGKSYFFDIPCERMNYEKNSTFPYVMAGLGTNEYCKNYDILGMLSQDGSEKLLSLPTNVSSKRISTLVLTGYDRKITDLTYSNENEKMM